MSLMRIQIIGIQNAIKVLEETGCRFGIETPDGEMFGLPLAKEKKRSEIKNRGCMEYCESVMQELSVGQAVAIPVQNFTIKAVQCCASSTGTKLFGQNSVTTHRNREQGAIEVMRVA